MAKPSDTGVPFDPDLDARLQRVYGSTDPPSLDRARRSLPSSQRSRGSKALQEALAELRNRRERAQSTMKMQEEIDYLRAQIALLRALGDEIDRLRRQLAGRR